MTTERPGVGEARIGRQERGGRTPPAELSSAAPFGDRLCDAIERLGTPACVGLDPVLERLPVPTKDTNGRPIGAADRIEAFCAGVIEAVAGVVPIVKPQSACFERFGQAGVGVLKRTIQLARQRGLIVILDAKRGDIGTTAEHYAAAAFGAGSSANAAPGAAARSGLDADAITLSGYMGMETVEPFLSAGGLGAGEGGRGVFVLVRTSNPGSDSIQAQRLADGRTVAELMADEVAALGRAGGRVGASGWSCVGAVVGATKSGEGAVLRKRMPEQMFLVPGFGAQGGTIEDIRPMLRGTGSVREWGVVVNASRSVLYPGETGGDWKRHVRDAAARFAEELRGLGSK